MSINKILVHTQYEENYGFDEGKFHWKKKGGHTFQIEMDADLIMYSDPAKVFSKMLESQNTDIERFTYIDHEIQFQVPTILGTQEDYIKANQSIDEDGSEDNHTIAGVDFSENINQLNNLSIFK
tara:strand:+ start:935 stop:1306 length:372 start_codon:yes stop_codon:yes gene_type:complete